MGGIDPVTIALASGTMVGEEVSKRNAQKSQIKSMENQQQLAVSQRKNLLDQQLASRRAMLGSMGVSMDGSNQASQKKIVDDGYEDINNVNADYALKYSNLNNKYKQNAYSTASSFGRKVLI